MKNLLMILIGLAAFASACTDPDKDPLKFDQIKKGSLITLRGQALNNLSVPDFRGACDKFSISGDPASENFEFDTDFLADDINSLSEVQIYASATDGGARIRIGTIAGSSFSVAAGTGIYPRASVSIPLNTILSAIGKSVGDYSVNQYIYIQCDLTLTDGSTVPASSFNNLSLFESALFYPAHKLLYVAKD